MTEDAELRRSAFAVAYRMLGSVAEAEDVVQETLLRLHRAGAEGEEISSPGAYVATVATRLAIDELRSARVRRERYVGDWLPEPLVAEADPAHAIEMADSLSMAFLVLLESLSPEQRAALLLRDVFDYGYSEVAEIIGTSDANARQLVARARRHVEERKPRFEATRERQQELAERFLAAARDGDLAGLEALLAQDVILQGDGGGKVPQLARALHGANRVARTLTNWTRVMHRRLPGSELRHGQRRSRRTDGRPRRSDDLRVVARVRGGPDPGRPFGCEPGQAHARRAGLLLARRLVPDSAFRSESDD